MIDCPTLYEGTMEFLSLLQVTYVGTVECLCAASDNVGATEFLPVLLQVMYVLTVGLLLLLL
jgi:hypothetical protein